MRKKKNYSINRPFSADGFASETSQQGLLEGNWNDILEPIAEKKIAHLWSNFDKENFV